MCIQLLLINKLASAGNRAARSGGRDKFVEVESLFLPPAMPIWANALKGVDRSSSRLVQIRKAEAHYGHYALPEPALFVSPASDEKKAAYLLTWLRARPALLYRLVKQQPTALSNQTWRDFLEMGRNPAIGRGTKSAKSRDLICRVMGTSFDLITDHEISSPPVLWGDRPLAADRMPATVVVREILWELFELNFRIELFSLDCRASTAHFDTANRLERVQNCFIDSDLLSAPIPSANQGLVADCWQQRLPFILAFSKILSSWHSFPSNLNSLLHQSQTLTEEQTTYLEQEVISFYVQTYYNYFGRAAILPHRIAHLD